MSLEIRCMCGWRCQASEYYLGDRLACPQCGAKILVHARSGIPYGYAPYPTWQKRFLMPAPRTRHIEMLPAEDPHASHALWLGIFSLLATLTGCGAVLGVILAVFGIRQSVRSARWNRRAWRPAQARARAGLVFSMLAMTLAGVMFISLLPTRRSRPADCSMPHSQPIQQRNHSQYWDSDAAQRKEIERIQRSLDEQRQRSAREAGDRYPAAPKPQVAPGVEDGQKVPEVRPQQESSNGNRYGK